MTTAAAAGSGRSGGGGGSSSSSSYSPAMLNLLAGGGAGVVETVMTYPLDLVRTRVQMAQAGAGGGSVLGLLRAIVETEGGLRRLYRGMLPPLVSEVPRRALKFTANDAYTRVLVGDGGGGGCDWMCDVWSVCTCTRTWYLQQLGGRDDTHRRSLPCPCSVMNSVREQTNPDGLVRPPAQLQWAGALVSSIHPSTQAIQSTLIPHTHASLPSIYTHTPPS